MDAEVIIEVYLFPVFFPASFLGVFIIGSISFTGFLNKFTNLHRVDGQLCLWVAGTVLQRVASTEFSLPGYLVVVQSVKKKT